MPKISREHLEEELKRFARRVNDIKIGAYNLSCSVGASAAAVGRTADRLYRYYRGEGSLTGGGLSFGERLAANKRVSRTLAAALPSVGMNGLFFGLLAYARPHIIICSKAVRIIREKYGAAAGEAVKSK